MALSQKGNVVDHNFIKGFEKESGLKEVGLASMLALSPMAAKAQGAFGKATQAVTKALTKQYGEHINQLKEKGLSKILPKKEKSLHIGAEANVGSAGSAASKASKPQISLRNLGTVGFKYDNFEGAVNPKRISGKYNINPNLHIAGHLEGKDKGISIGYQKSF